MIIKQLDLLPYELKLKNKFKNSKNIYFKKNGFVIKIVTDNYLGLGDVSYLQGFSKETLQEINWGFQSFKQSIGNNENYSFTELIKLSKVRDLQSNRVFLVDDKPIHRNRVGLAFRRLVKKGGLKTLGSMICAMISALV